MMLQLRKFEFLYMFSEKYVASIRSAVDFSCL